MLKAFKESAVTFLLLHGAARRQPPRRRADRYRRQAFVTAVLRQERTMNAVKRERWTEADVDALPPKEHDYFERKSGKVFADEDLLLAKVAKAISALANSGGGHLLLGVDDNGVPDGVPPAYKGRTTTRDWLEQVVPNLVSYSLADFRVHVVEPAAAASRI